MPGPDPRGAGRAGTRRRAGRLPRPGMPRLVPHRYPVRWRRSPDGRRAEPAAGHSAGPAGQLLLPQGRPRGRDELRRPHPHRRRHRVAADQRPFTPGGGSLMRVAILYDAGSDDWSPQDVAAVVGNVHEVRDVLRRRGHEVELLPVRLGDFRWLSRARRADLVFNLCEGINGHARFEDYIVGTLELTGVPFTGCRHWATTIAHRKHVANTLLSAAGVPVPAFTLAQANKTPADVPLPAIVKPAAEDASVGIDNGAVCTSKRALKKRVALMLEQFEEVLVQEYVAGREFNVGFVGRRMLPIAEILFDGMPEGTWPIVSYAAKWIPGSPEDEGTLPVCPAEVDADLAKRIGQVARDAWQYVSGSEGYGRVDLRLNDEGQPYVLEVNPCPDLSSNAGLARMGRAFGWNYDDLVMQVVDEALMRSQSSSAAAALVSGVSAA